MIGQEQIQKIQKERAESPNLQPPIENFTFRDMQYTAVWTYSWCKVKNISEDRIKQHFIKRFSKQNHTGSDKTFWKYKKKGGGGGTATSALSLNPPILALRSTDFISNMVFHTLQFMILQI